MGRKADEWILIVEDDHETAHGLADVLGILGYRTRIASNGRIALDMLRGTADDYCVVLLDIMMPVMDGWAFLDEHRNDPAISKIPVIIVSAVLNADIRSSKTLAVDVIPKPVDSVRLSTAIARYC